MSFFLDCPNCGPREVYEFRYGGEILDPDSRRHGTKSNLPGVQHERWYHRLGCRRWFAAERDVRTNLVVRTGWLADEPGPTTGAPEGKLGRAEGTAQGDEP
jgi:sarcosine oxidase subunit delta